MKRIKTILVLIIIFVALMAALIIPNTESKAQQTDKKYILKIDKDRLVLLADGEIIEEYSDFIIDVLPLTDREALVKGIEFDEINKARLAAEDYDG